MKTKIIGTREPWRLSLVPKDKLTKYAPEMLKALQGLLNDFEYYISEQETEPSRAGYIEVSKKLISKILGNERE